MKKKFLLYFCLFLSSGCSLVDLASIKILNHKTSRPESKIIRDIAYRPDGAKKHRLDLFLPDSPDSKAWPVLVFVHGGGWDSGDKSLKVLDVEPYANIGRFFAAHGIGVAVISYPLLPKVSWQEQIQDVAGATAWVHRHVHEYGGNPQRLFLAGHSAGAQLATRVALDPDLLRKEGLSKKIVKGVIAVSGAGYEIEPVEDEELRSAPASNPATWRSDYFAKRFGKDDPSGAWAQEVSLLRFIDLASPPFLIIHATAEPASIIKQSKLLNRRLQEENVPTRTVVIPHRDHIQIMMLLSRENAATEAIQDFVKKNGKF